MLDLEYSAPRTIVLIPSISFEGLTAKYLVGLNFFEERNLFYLACLKNPKTRFIAVLSEGFQECFINYCIEHISQAYNLGVYEIKERFEIVSIPTDGKQYLTKNILQNAEFSHRINNALIDKTNTLIDYWMVTDSDARLAMQLGLAYYGLQAEAFNIDSKASSRKIFRTLDIAIPAGRENLASFQEVQLALQELLEEASSETFIIKINQEEGGNGLAKIARATAFLPYQEFLDQIQITKNIPISEFEAALQQQKAVLEAYIEAEIVAFPSVKMEILSDGVIRNLATHDQLLKDMTYSGSIFPADPSYRSELIKLGQKISTHIAKLGVFGIASVDFLATKNSPNDTWKFWGIEINARKGATTHSIFWSKWLTKAEYDQSNGVLQAITGEIMYQASEYFWTPNLSKIPPETILAAIKNAGLDFDHQKQSGVFVHMLSCVPKFGKFGATIIGHTKEEVTDYWEKLEQLLATQFTSDVNGSD